MTSRTTLMTYLKLARVLHLSAPGTAVVFACVRAMPGRKRNRGAETKRRQSMLALDSFACLVLSLCGLEIQFVDRFLLHAPQIAKAKGILVVAVTQCLRGGVSLSTYAVGVALERNGVLSGGDMTTERSSRHETGLPFRTDEQHPGK